MKKLRIFLVLALLLCISVGVYAGGRQEARPQRITLKLMTYEPAFPTDWWERWNAENPDLQIVRTEWDWTKFVADAMAGTAADLNVLGSGADVAYYAERGLLLDLTEYFKKATLFTIDDIDKGGNSSYQWDGREFGKGSWYGLSRDFNNVGAITYNKKMFADAGIGELSTTTPITYMDDVYNLAKKLTKKDASGNVVTWGTEFQSWVSYLVSDMAYANEVSFFADRERSVMNDSPKMREQWKYWARFQAEDLAPNVRNPSPGWQGTNFQSDRVAFVQLGYWFGAQLQAEADHHERFGWAPTPILRPGARRYTNTLGATGLVIHADTKYPDEAFRFFEWYMAGDYAVHDAKSGWGIPPLKSLWQYLPQDTEYNRIRTQIAFDDAKHFVPVMSSPFATISVYAEGYGKYIDELVRKEISADAFVDKMHGYINELLKLGKEEIGG